MSEHSNSFRYRTSRSAKIFPSCGGALDCSVNNISTKGAGLVVADSKQVPDDFFLMIQGLSDRFRCHVVERNGNEIEVQYLYK